MKRIHALAVAVAWALMPAPSWGVDVRAGLGGEVEFDSNARRTPTNEQKDVIFRIVPYVEVREDQSKFNYLVRYRFPWERAIEVQRIDGFRHFLNAQGEYSFSERTVLTFVNDFTRTDSVNSLATAEDGVSTVSTFNEPVNRNRMRLSLSHNLTPRLQTTATFNFRLFDSDLPSRANNRTFGGVLGSNYLLTPRHRVGGGVSVDYQDFDASNNGSRTPSQTLFANLFASWSWVIDETTTLEVAAGPTYIDTNQDALDQFVNTSSVPFAALSSGLPIVVNDIDGCQAANVGGSTVQILELNRVCGRGAIIDDTGYQRFIAGEPEPQPRVDWETAYPGQVDTIRGEIASIRNAATNAAELRFGPGRPDSLSSTSWTVFARTALTKRWSPTLISTASYERRDSTASGIAGSAVVDFVSLLTTWQITELWDAALRADWTRRESTGPVNQTLLVVGATPTTTGPPPLDLTDSVAFNDDGTGIFPSGIAYNTAFTTRRVSQSIDTTRWGLQARVRRRITRNLSTGLRYTFNRQNSQQGTAGGFSDFNDHLVTLNVQYDFDRWNVW